MGGNILAINEGFRETGYRPVLIVKAVHRYRQRNATRGSTVLEGDQVLLPFLGAVGTATPTNYAYNEWFANLVGVPKVWNQMRALVNENTELYMENWPKLPVFPVGQAEMVLRAAGSDPIHGNWLQFEGNIPLFRGEWWVETDDELLDYEQLAPMSDI
jgi:hypothetical protein